MFCVVSFRFAYLNLRKRSLFVGATYKQQPFERQIKLVLRTLYRVIY